MFNNDIMKKLEEIGLKAASENGYELIDIEYVKEHGSWYLRYYIDKEDGVTLDDCQRVSEAISYTLDVIDPMPGSYILEVSSPGVERPLKTKRDFEKAIDSKVQIKTFEPINDKKVFIGYIKDVSDTSIMLLENGKNITIPLDKISLAKVKFEWSGE